MSRNLCCAVCGLTLAALWLSPASLSAQEEVLSYFYGSGVHNFYERDYFEAKADLSAAIDGGSNDPRVYYYRALANMRTGNSPAAQRDLQKGAELEAADVDQFYPVAKSLERVQGRDRLELERYRALARAQARQRQMRRDAERYEQRRRAEAQVLRNVPLGPPPAPLQPSAVVPATATEPSAQPAEVTPFDEKPAAATPAPPKPATVGLFDEPPAEKPADKKPAATKPAVEKPAADPAADEAGAAEMKDDEGAKNETTEEDPFADDGK